MKHLVKIFIAFIALCPLRAGAQSIHLISFADTDDDKIGQATIVDRENMIREISNLASYIDYDIFVYDYYGDECNKDYLYEVVDEADITPEDIVVFFYSGHGARAMNNEEDPFPQMCLGSNYDSEFVPVQKIVNKLALKNPKFILAVSNCCNKEDRNVSIKPLLAQMSGASSISSVDNEAYRQLINNAAGQAVITSSKAGQYSWCVAGTGGLFTCDFLDVLLLVGQGKVAPYWEDVFSQVQQKTQSRQISIAEPPYTASQVPYYEVRKSVTKPVDIDDDELETEPRRKSETRKDDSDFNSRSNLSIALNSLVDQSVSRDQRLQEVPNVLRTYFAPGAKVRTLGRNGMTVDYENAEDFLRRIALARRIARITIINESGDDKKNEISIHEIHK